MKAAAVFLIGGILGASPAAAAKLATYPVIVQSEAASFVATGTVQADRQGTLASQVSGRITEVRVRSGDEVEAGQALVQIEVGDSADTVAASAAAASGAAARLVGARADFARAQRLQAQEYLSVAALQRAEAALRSAEAEAQATDAQAKAARTRAGWHSVLAPYAGRVTDLWVSAGDLATPGKPLLGLYNPTALRVIAQVPESMAARVQTNQPALLLVGESSPVTIATWRLISAVDPATHSVEVRAELPTGSGLEPGQFVSLLLPLHGDSREIRIPLSAVLRRSELVGVYVIDAEGTAHLRQVRLGPVTGDAVIVLSGLRSGENIALDPVSAGRQ